MRVLVAEPLAEEGVARLRDGHDVDVRTGLDRQAFLEALPGYHALMVRSQVQVDAEAIAAGRDLVVIGRAGVGVDNVDLDAATRAGITVVNAPTGNTTAAAEHTLALLFAVARRIAAADGSVRRGEWKRSALTGVELRGRTLGVVGLGKIGMALADRARALEMRLVGYDPFVTPETAAHHGISLLELPALIASADVISLHVPLTHATKDLLNAERIASMRSGAIILNVARGGLVDESALAAALHDGRVGGAGIDVFGAEPPRDSPLLGAPNTVLTPHLGASTAEAQVRVAEEAAEQVLDVLAGRPARYAVNAPLVPPETAEALAPWLGLAQALGQFAAQFARGGSERLTLHAGGELAQHDTTPLVAAVLRGLLESVTEERVNQVNALHLARARGIAVVEQRTTQAERYPALLTVRVEAADGSEVAVSGTVAAGEPRIVRLRDYWVDMSPATWMLVTRHRDRPGTMGRIGQMLGEADVNISAMHLARRAPREDALMVLALDDPVPDPVATRLRAHEDVLDLWIIRLSA
jgi:D-3-phosphoglycerate dehydrogenase / 2-oxoglutarate reductase